MIEYVKLSLLTNSRKTLRRSDQTVDSKDTYIVLTLKNAGICHIF